MPSDKDIQARIDKAVKAATEANKGKTASKVPALAKRLLDRVKKVLPGKKKRLKRGKK